MSGRFIEREVTPMRRRELLKHAALAAAGMAASTPRGAEAGAPERLDGQGRAIGKVALEEHFLIPDFVEYFAETYPNISPEIRKFGTGVLQELGEPRLSVIDQFGVEFAVQSIAGPGGKWNGTPPLRRAGPGRPTTSCPRRSRRTPSGTAGSRTWRCRTRRKPRRNSSAASASWVSRAR